MAAGGPRGEAGRLEGAQPAGLEGSFKRTVPGGGTEEGSERSEPGGGKTLNKAGKHSPRGSRRLQREKV